MREINFSEKPSIPTEFDNLNKISEIKLCKANENKAIKINAATDFYYHEKTGEEFEEDFENIKKSKKNIYSKEGDTVTINGYFKRKQSSFAGFIRNYIIWLYGEIKSNDVFTDKDTSIEEIITDNFCDQSYNNEKYLVFKTLSTNDTQESNYSGVYANKAENKEALFNSISKLMSKDGKKYSQYKIVYTYNNDESENKEMSTNSSEQVPQEKVIDLINNGAKQIIFTGAPGTGKTYTAKQIAEGKIKESIKGGELNGKNYEFVQFHPSYDYTDFVEGLRPVKINDKVEFVKIDGIFKRFCREVVNNGKNDEKYYFIIDEINRADLSKVFGELMYCLESDKRGENNKVNTQYQNIDTYYYDKENNVWTSYEAKNDVFKDGFYIPENVIILGTMNDIDRSVESMDFALRRRFEWVEFKVDKTMLKKAFDAEDSSEKAIYGDIIVQNANDIANKIMSLNNVIEGDGKAFGLNRQYFISQGQFAHLESNGSITDSNSLLEYVWNYRIESLLREYVRGEDENEIDTFIGNCRKALLKGDGKQSDDSESSGVETNE